jgi:2-aminobenzoylacetyl-CoA thioesterase
MDPKPIKRELTYPVKWTQHLWLLGIPEFPSFLAVGRNGCALIEAGVSALVPKILKDLESLQLSVPLRFLVAAHAHADHVSGLIRLKHLFPELILTGSGETARILKKETIIQNFKREDRMYAKYLADEGFIGVSDSVLPEDPAAIDREYPDRACIDLGNVQIRLIDAPGHAPGNSVFRIEPDNVVLISDSAGYANSDADILPLFFHHFGHAVSSLEKIKSLNADHIGLGHNVVISGRNSSLAFLDRAIQKTYEMRSAIIECSGDEAGILRYIQEMSGRMRGYGLFKSFSPEIRETYARLLFRRALESDGTVAE